MIVIYEVNLSVDSAIADAYAAWLADHIREMLKIPGFFRARWYERRPEDEGRDPAEVALWTVSYDVYSRDDLERYFREDAPRMRGDGVARFGGRFEASRRILEPRSLGGEPLGLDT